MTAIFNPFAEAAESLCGWLQSKISGAGCSRRLGESRRGPCVSSQTPEVAALVARRRESIGLSLFTFLMLGTCAEWVAFLVCLLAWSRVPC